MPTATPTPFTADLTAQDREVDLSLNLPDPLDEAISEPDFQQQVEMAWQVCDRFDLQTDIWRGRILRTVRDREKKGGDQRGSGFLQWLKDREISKTQAYNLIELADSADTLIQDGMLEPQDVNQFSKRAFVETAQASPEVQQIVSEAAHRGDSITRREVRQLSDEWTAMNSDLIPDEIKAKAAENTIPTRYLAPLVREMEKLPPIHQQTLRDEVALAPDVDTLKQVTAEARSLSKYLASSIQVQALQNVTFDLEAALEEALRVGCLNATADMVNQAAQVEQATAKLFTAWKQVSRLAERVYVDSGASTPNLRSLLDQISPLGQQTIHIQLGDPTSPLSQTIRITLESESIKE